MGGPDSHPESYIADPQGSRTCLDPPHWSTCAGSSGRRGVLLEGHRRPGDEGPRDLVEHSSYTLPQLHDDICSRRRG